MLTEIKRCAELITNENKDLLQQIRGFPSKTELLHNLLSDQLSYFQRLIAFRSGTLGIEESSPKNIRICKLVEYFSSVFS